MRRRPSSPTAAASSRASARCPSGLGSRSIALRSRRKFFPALGLAIVLNDLGMVEGEGRDTPDRDKFRPRRVRARAESPAKRAKDVRHGYRVASRIPPRVAVHAEQADDLRLEPRLLEDFAFDAVLEPLAPFEAPTWQSVLSEERRPPALHKDKLPFV